MAGWDSAGQEFAAAYDDAAGALFISMSHLIDGAGQIADLLHATGFNHANADDPGSAPDAAASDYPPAPNLSAISRPAVRTPPSANGGDDDPPWGWSLVETAVGYLWPNGDESKLRSAASAWRLAGAGLGTAALPIHDAIDMVAAQQSPEVGVVTDACEEYRAQLLDIADCCASLAAACDEYADHLATAHEEILDLLNQLLWETAVIGTIGVAGAFVTAGGAAAGGSAAVAARVTMYAARISTVIDKLVAATGFVGRTIIAIVGRSTEVGSRIWAAVMSRSQVLASKIPGVSHLGRIPLKQELDNAQVWRGRFPNDGGPPNGFLVRRDQQGNVTHYIQYDSDGKGIKRVDITGASHAGVPTPHVVDI
ncbi:hypothetical protein G4H71_07680 [Rhodococcus triatomae]|uniref:WXG100-like domain-containing protein n=1 Tax=Rhodococcus triatomae TaxID=300028 RepID=UPI0009F64268|nr:polymorphic toxin type 24 domain-containing protein [Rhodococcus triatomae]QNG17399.1 hypothetical protein G4H72_00365 [Rhodococcus triatomae]QNG22933.1 hypothetical protein G4H71_07680 [Rhodococcus triatomae]